MYAVTNYLRYFLHFPARPISFFFTCLSLLHAAVSQVGEGWYLVVQVLKTSNVSNSSTTKQGRCEIFLAKIAPCNRIHSPTIKVGEQGLMQTKGTTNQARI